MEKYKSKYRILALYAMLFALIISQSKALPSQSLEVQQVSSSTSITQQQMKTGETKLEALSEIQDETIVKPNEDVTDEDVTDEDVTDEESSTSIKQLNTQSTTTNTSTTTSISLPNSKKGQRQQSNMAINNEAIERLQALENYNKVESNKSIAQYTTPLTSTIPTALMSSTLLSTTTSTIYLTTTSSSTTTTTTITTSTSSTSSTPRTTKENSSIPKKTFISASTQIDQSLFNNEDESNSKSTSINIDSANLAQKYGISDYISAISDDVLDSMFDDAAHYYGIDPALLKAIAFQESSWVVSSTSHVGASGVMQIMPDTGTWLSEKYFNGELDYKNAADNIELGAVYIQYLTARFKSQDLVIGAFFQGPNSVAENGLLGYAPTYVEGVTSLISLFR